MIKAKATFLVFTLITSVALADTYKWVDDKGVVHFTDDPDRIPARYLNKVKQLPSMAPEAAPPAQAPAAPSPAPAVQAPRKPESQLFGGKEGQWWQSRFGALRDELKRLQEGLPAKRDQLNILRRKRVIYQGVQERIAYNEMKGQIERDEARATELEKELAALEQEASKAGVPAEWRR